MPKINAPTVVEHRAAQRRALLDAARGLLAEGLETAPSIAAVAAKAGMARPTAYQYFTSRDDLLDGVIADVFPRWSRQITETVAAADSPAGRVLAYVEANLRMVAEGEHAVARALSAIAPRDRLAKNSRELHESLMTPLIESLAELGLPDPAATAEMINAVVYSASRMIESGTPHEGARARAKELLTPFLDR